MLVSRVVHVLMSAQWVLFLKATFTLLMLTCVPSAALVLMFAQVKQSLNNNCRFATNESSSFHLRTFFVKKMRKGNIDIANLKKK